MFLPSKLLKSSNNKGFTLVELMVVVSIIAILSVVGVTVYSGIQTKAQDAKRRADIDAISNAIEVHFDSAAGKYAAGSDTWFSSGAAPQDPVAKTDYTGWSSVKTGSSATYNVCATLSGGTAGCTATSATCYCKQQQQ